MGDHDHPPPRERVDFVESLGPVMDALDIGCGDGRVTAFLRAHRVTGADVSAVALERARARVPEAHFVQLRPDEPLPLEDASFDLVLCAEALEHVRDVQLFLSEARRVLRPRGELALSTPARRALTWTRTLDPLSPHIRFFTRRSLRALLDAMGFDVVSQRSRRGTLFVRATRP